MGCYSIFDKLSDYDKLTRNEKSIEIIWLQARCLSLFMGAIIKL